MAGIVTITEQTYTSIQKITFEWTSSAGGAADGTTTEAYTGELLRVVTIPGTAATQPTDQYDVVLNDSSGADVLAGAGANRSNANTEQALKASLGCVAGEPLALAVTNAGNAKTGKVILYVR